MRWSSFLLVLFAAAFLFACGGDDEYVTDPGGGDSADGGGAGKTADASPPKKEAPRASPMAAKLARVRKMVKAVKDPGARKKKALEQAELFAGQTVIGDAVFYHAELWRYGEEFGKAADTYLKFVSASPTDLNAKYGLYYAAVNLVKAGRVTEAPAQVTNLAEKFPGEKKLIRSAAKTAGDMMLANGDVAGAIVMLDVAVDNDDKYAGEELVRCMWATGKYDEARTKSTQLASNFNGDTEEKRYNSLADLSSRMGKPVIAMEPEGWAKERFDSEALKGNPYLVYFWNVKARGPSVRNEVALKKIYDRYNGEGLEIVGFSKHSQFNLVENKTDPSMGTDEEIYNLKVWAENYVTPWIFGLVEGDKFHNFFGYRGKTPTIALVGKKGNLRYFRDSSDPQSYQIITRVIEQLLEE